MTEEPSPVRPVATTAPATEPRLTFRAETDGSTRADLMEGERSVSRLWIVPLTLRIGAATVRMDGIGGVGTEDEFRRRGYSRRVLEATVERMRQGEAALSMLYGIPHFYPKFGYATAGPDQFITLTRLTDAAVMPAGWRVRTSTSSDLPSIRRLYEERTALGVGCAVRSPDGAVWKRLARPEAEDGDDCRVVVDREEKVRAYAWHARWHWYVGILEREQPDALVIAEVVADGAAAADAILAACRQWATEEEARRSRPVRQVVLSLPPEGPVAAAAMHQSATFLQRFVPCGSSMARVLDVGRLLEALTPELGQRLHAVGCRFAGAVRFQTEVGDAILAVSPDGVTVERPNHLVNTKGAASGERLELRLPQTTLARLALGAFPPGDLLARLEQPPDERTRRLMEMLFPLRHPHLYLPDRF
jgi:predicted acetyltransferase